VVAHPGAPTLRWKGSARVMELAAIGKGPGTAGAARPQATLEGVYSGAEVWATPALAYMKAGPCL